ncbi:hypothetical protein AVEN_47984-1 [Araneus ventricosus]|uniref:Uncharacterized protein n=1 Tax=Araneus ventricosus TaxID=182803 RepID=A0A4Y2MYJ5_ARAVE|nr:hypothetical protein AVEN_47984-1 [Araneus ventricosus]
MTHKGTTAGLLKRGGEVKNGRHDSNREPRSVPTLATAQPLPKEIRPVIGVEVTQSHSVIVLPNRSENPLIYPAASDLSTRGAPGNSENEMQHCWITFSLQVTHI